MSLNVMMRHSFVKLTGDDVLVAHTFAVIKLTKLSLGNAARNKRIKAKKRIGLFALFLSVFFSLEA